MLAIVLLMGLDVEQINRDNRMHAVVLAVIYCLVLMFLVVSYQLLKGRSYKLSPRDLIGFSLIPICEVLMLSGFFGFALATGELGLHVMTLLAAALTCASVVLLFRSMRRVAESAGLEARYAFLQTQQAQQMEHYEALSVQLREARKQRHDFLNYVETLEILLRQGQEEKTATCSRELRDMVLAVGEVSYCDEPVVNALLYHKLQHAGEEGIRTEVRLSLKAGCGIADTDLICLFSNLLDNALAGCQTAEGERFISVTDKTAAGFYTLTVSNSKGDQTVSFQGERPVRKSGEGHGLGTEILQDLARRYEGACRFYDEGGRFKAIVMLHPVNTPSER